MRSKLHKNIIIGLVLAAAVFVFLLLARTVEKVVSVSLQGIHPIRTVIIDPGHGGADGGATGIGGVVEKDLNLQISLKLRDLLRVSGYDVVMTRETDRSIDTVGDSLAQQKKSDMRNRLQLIRQTPNALTLSIHQNHYEASSVSGAQMFYGGKNRESRLLAESIQKRFVQNLQKENDREIKQAGKDLYLMYYAESPIVLVECGFISNPIESALLSDDTYQNKVAFTIFSGMLDYLNQE